MYIDKQRRAVKSARRLGWPFVAWCLLLLLLISGAANVVFIALLLGWR